MTTGGPVRPIEETAKDDKCPECYGTGFVEKEGGIIQEICPSCGGTGIKGYMTQDGAAALTLEEAMEARMPHLSDQPAVEPVEPKPHKHNYRKDGTCACGAALSAKQMKRRELKAKR